MFLIPIIKKQQHKFNYGHKWYEEALENSRVILPYKNNNQDFAFMEHYVNTLKFSKSL